MSTRGRTRKRAVQGGRASALISFRQLKSSALPPPSPPLPSRPSVYPVNLPADRLTLSWSTSATAEVVSPERKPHPAHPLGTRSSSDGAGYRNYSRPRLRRPALLNISVLHRTETRAAVRSKSDGIREQRPRHRHQDNNWP